MALQRSSNPAIYRAALLNQMLGVPVISLANSFSYSLNKKRFKMMKKKIDSPFRKLKMLMVLPFIAIVFYAFAKPEYIRFASASQTENVSAVNEGKEVSGKVTNPDGKPLQKATVLIKGTTIGTVTDADGNFKLVDVKADAKLFISYVGMKIEELKPDFNKPMTVKMEVATIGIEKFVVVGFNTPPASSSGKPGFSAIEQMPRFPGGQQALMGFIRDNLKYPVQAQEEKKTGTVVVNFLVSSTGKIENVKVAKSVHPALDAEAVRVVSKMPDWFPGKQNGKPVDVYYSVPFEFKLN
jgi:TonB family protein